MVTTIRTDSKGQSCVREKGKDFAIVVFCIGTKDACNKRAALIEKTMDTDANDDEDISDDKAVDSDDSGEGIGDDICANIPTNSRNNQKLPRLINSSSYGSITSEYVKTTKTTYTSTAPVEHHISVQEEILVLPLSAQNSMLNF